MSHLPLTPMGKSKYNVSAAEERTADGILFDSKKEMKHWITRKAQMDAGEILDIWRQVIFRYPDDTYKCDFVVFWADGCVTVEDVKGFRTPEYKRKVKLQKKYHPLFPIREH